MISGKSGLNNHPTCRLCGHRHALGGAHIWGTGASSEEEEHGSEEDRPSIAPPAKPASPDPHPAPSTVAAARLVTTDAPKFPFDRTEYMRRYMRDKRAADKLGMTIQEYRHGGAVPKTKVDND